MSLDTPNTGNVSTLHKKVHVVCVQSVLWLHAPMVKWLGSLCVNQTSQLRILLMFFFFLLAMRHILHLQFIGPDGHSYEQPN